MRFAGRKRDQMRKMTIETNILSHAEGSCLIKIGNTHVVCSASLEDMVPRFIKGTGSGWVTAEYGMLPRSTGARMQREASSGKQTGRTLEIQRLIGRSLRAAIDLNKLGEKQIYIDCDVINADGGTRTASITGAYIALHLAVRNLLERKIIRHNPLVAQIAAVSCGIVNGEILLDLDYEEDRNAAVDANFVFNSYGKLIEVQSTGEKTDFTAAQLQEMITVCMNAGSDLFALQNSVLLNLK